MHPHRRVQTWCGEGSRDCPNLWYTVELFQLKHWKLEYLWNSNIVLCLCWNNYNYSRSPMKCGCKVNGRATLFTLMVVSSHVATHKCVVKILKRCLLLNALFVHSSGKTLCDAVQFQNLTCCKAPLNCWQLRVFACQAYPKMVKIMQSQVLIYIYR